PSLAFKHNCPAILLNNSAHSIFMLFVATLGKTIDLKQFINNCLIVLIIHPLSVCLKNVVNFPQYSSTIDKIFFSLTPHLTFFALLIKKSVSWLSSTISI